MFTNITKSYTGADASLEIAIMLFGAFVLGMMFSWFLRPGKSVEEVGESDGIVEDDNLQLIDGVGPAIVKLLHEYGIESYADIVKADVSGLEEVLLEGGKSYKRYSPATWPDQARLALEKKWRELEEYQEILAQKKKEKI